MPIRPGSKIGRYHILEKLGEGGMAVVFKGRDTLLDKEVALKFIRIESLSARSADNSKRRFLIEAKQMAKLDHPNIVKVTDYGEFGGIPYLVMPFIDGGNLKELMGKSIPWNEAIKLLIPVADALAYIHQNKLIHRDIKPSNILINNAGIPLLTDFGIAKVLESEFTVDLTGTNVGIGTPEYVAPEQASSKEYDHRADIYSLGVVLYEMITGRRPFEADTPLAVLLMKINDPMQSPRKLMPKIPKKIEALLIKMLAKNPSDRYEDANSLKNKLIFCLEDSSQFKITKMAGALFFRLILAIMIIGIIVNRFLAKEIISDPTFLLSSTKLPEEILPSIPKKQLVEDSMLGLATPVTNLENDIYFDQEKQSSRTIGMQTPKPQSLKDFYQTPTFSDTTSQIFDSNCLIGQDFYDERGDSKINYLDIVKVSSNLDQKNLMIIIFMDLLNSQSKLDVYIDSDNNDKTGIQQRYYLELDPDPIIGSEYLISIEDPFDINPISLLRCNNAGTSCQSISQSPLQKGLSFLEAKISVNKTENSITIIAPVPGISEISRIVVRTNYEDIAYCQ